MWCMLEGELGGVAARAVFSQVDSNVVGYRSGGLKGLLSGSQGSVGGLKGAGDVLASAVKGSGRQGDLSA